MSQQTTTVQQQQPTANGSDTTTGTTVQDSNTTTMMVRSRNYLGKPNKSKVMIPIKRPIYDFPINDFSIFGKVSESDLLNNCKYARHTALCFIPSEDIWNPIQDIRQELDKGMERWPPHINLLFPFVPENCFDAAKQLLTSELENFKPFDCTFDSVSYFEKGSSVLWLNQDESARNNFVHLQKRVAKLFPYCNEKKNEESSFIPHLTIGYASQTILQRVHKQVNQEWSPKTVHVGEICMIYRPDVNTCFRVIHRIPLGGK